MFRPHFSGANLLLVSRDCMNYHPKNVKDAWKKLQKYSGKWWWKMVIDRMIQFEKKKLNKSKHFKAFLQSNHTFWLLLASNTSYYIWDIYLLISHKKYHFHGSYGTYPAPTSSWFPLFQGCQVQLQKTPQRRSFGLRQIPRHRDVLKQETEGCDLKEFSQLSRVGDTKNLVRVNHW